MSVHKNQSTIQNSAPWLVIIEIWISEFYALSCQKYDIRHAYFHVWEISISEYVLTYLHKAFYECSSSQCSAHRLELLE